MQVQWFPGHMAKARRQVAENLKLVDIVIELLDARIPVSSRNPMINQIIGAKPRMVILNKADLADEQATRQWVASFADRGISAVTVNSINGQGMNLVPKVGKDLAQSIMAARSAKGIRPRAIRAMILGIPNVGKSSFINRLTGGNRAKTGDKPGVTRGPQWVRVNPEFELLDTPGILWPKFEDPEVGVKLAVTGAVSDLVTDVEELAVRLLELIVLVKPEALSQRYKVADVVGKGVKGLEEIGRRRGYLIHGGEVDLSKAAVLVLKEFREGLLGRITLDKIEDNCEK